MAKNRLTQLGLAAIFLVGLAALAALAHAQDPGPLAALGTAFTYQGNLRRDGTLYSGTCTMNFRLYDALSGGTLKGTVSNSTVPISNSLFTVGLDFGANAFPGDRRWLEIDVNCPGDSGGPTILPRQELTAAPYALNAMTALNATTAVNATSALNATYALTATSAAGLQGRPVAGVAPATGQVLQWDSAAWSPGTVVSGAHTHWGQTWTGAGTGLTLSGGSVGLSGSGTVTGVVGVGGPIGLYGRGVLTGVVGVGPTGLYGAGSTYGVYGSSGGNYGVYGTGSYYGVYGTGSYYGVSGNGSEIGVDGTGGSYGLYGTGPTGVYGTGSSFGVYGLSDVTGVYGTGSDTGVDGEGGSYGVRGQGVVTGVVGLGPTGLYGGGSAYGLYATSPATAVYGKGGSYGVRGQGVVTGVVGLGPTGLYGGGSNYGVYGTGSTGLYGAGGATGVYGNGSTYGLLGYSGNYGVYGMGGSYGIYGQGVLTGVVGLGPTGVYGSGSSCGVCAQGGHVGLDARGTDYGVYAQNTRQGSGTGVYALGSTGVWGEGAFGVIGKGDLRGVEGVGTGSDGVGVYGSAPSTGYAGWFQGDVNVNGTLYKPGGSFRIDHPLDPAGKYLSHSFVESPDMMNIYNGTVALGADGTAWVTLPDWFQALNRDFRYQLTAIGAPGPNLYVAQEIQENRFQVAGGGAGLKVSWQVTGIRQDAWANAHRIPVEEAKPAAEKGTYLHPELFGQPASLGLDARLKAGGR